MKFFKHRRNVLDLEFNTSQGQRNGNTSLLTLNDEKASTLNFMLQLTALMLTLPTITALLLMWLEIR